MQGDFLENHTGGWFASAGDGPDGCDRSGHWQLYSVIRTFQSRSRMILPSTLSNDRNIRIMGMEYHSAR
ncbi:hypothetical protein, partial [Arthrobacter rhombi]|uniref:hypothetical protein n=1 Tax=Arthrobacter rhombi TaxID=71253 RepID=UPI003FD02385